MTLYINACVREDSRTHRIASALLSKLGGSFEELRLEEELLFPLTGKTLEKRTALIEKGDFSDPLFRYARQFAAADRIVISAPYWDMSYPASLKVYLENVYVVGIVSEYGADGVPHGLCKADELYYVTTAGGPYVPDFSFGHISRMSKECFGIPKTTLIKAEMLDVYGSDPEAIVENAIKNLH